MISEPTLDLLKDLHEAVAEEDWDRVTFRSGHEMAPTVGLAPALLFQDRLNYDPNKDDDDDPIWSIYVHIARLYVQALLEQGEFEKVVKLLIPSKAKGTSASKSTSTSTANSNDGTLPDAVIDAVGPGPRLYAMYRLERYAAVQQQATSSPESQILSTSSSLLLQHLQAQAAYNTQDYVTAETVYAKMIQDEMAGQNDDNDDEEEESLVEQELLVNWTAAQSAHFLPWSGETTPSSMDHDNDDPIFAEIEKLLDENQSPDLAYNMATWKRGTSMDASNDALFKAALEHIHANGEDLTPQELAKERIPVQWNLAWSQLWWQGAVGNMNNTIDSTASMKHASRTARLIGLANQALSTKDASMAVRLLPTPSPSLTALQNNLLYYNRAVLLYRSKDWTSCAAILDEWTSQLTSTTNTTSGSKKKAAKQQTSSSGTANQSSSSSTLRLASSTVESTWWTSRAVVLQALCKIQQSPSDRLAAVKLVQDQLDRVQKLSSNAKNIQSQLMTYLVVHKACMAQPESLSTEDKMELLQSLPQEKAVTATLVSLYHEQGKEAEAIQLLEDTGNSEALVDFWINQGQYEKVVESLKDQIDEDEIAKARYIQALSYTDPAKAHELWSSWDPELLDDEDLPSGADLETQELPRLKYHKKPTVKVDAAVLSTKKSHDAVLRQRSRKREAYIASLEARGLPVQTTPDPERWLSKYERSYNRRRRRQNNSQKGAHQGGASEAEAAKLDVAARQAARAAGNVAINKSSTAHLSAVSGGGPRRRRN